MDMKPDSWQFDIAHGINVILFFFLAASPSGHTIKDHETVSVYKLQTWKDDFFRLLWNWKPKYHQ